MTEVRDARGDFTIRFEDREGYLYASVTGGVDTADISLRYWQMISDECRARDSRKVLVVESFATPSSMIDVYTVASELPRLMKGVRIAFIDEAAGDYEENIFGETVAVNRGATGRVFRDEQAAIRWLQS